MCVSECVKRKIEGTSIIQYFLYKNLVLYSFHFCSVRGREVFCGQGRTVKVTRGYFYCFRCDSCNQDFLCLTITHNDQFNYNALVAGLLYRHVEIHERRSLLGTASDTKAAHSWYCKLTRATNTVILIQILSSKTSPFQHFHPFSQKSCVLDKRDPRCCWSVSASWIDVSWPSKGKLKSYQGFWQASLCDWWKCSASEEETKIVTRLPSLPLTACSSLPAPHCLPLAACHLHIGSPKHIWALVMSFLKAPEDPSDCWY